MQRKHLLVPLAAAAAALFAGQASALDFHGYLRAGAGQSSAGGSQQCFSLPGAYAKYRLGNECNTYGELQFDQNLYDGKDGVKFDYHVMLAINSDYANQQDYEQLTTDNKHLAFRQSWVEVKNLPGLGGATVWAGKRYYERQDIHINDFYYWDPSGYGVGIQGVPAFGDAKFSYALFQNSQSTAGQNVSIWRHDFRLGGIGLGGFGDLTVGVNLNMAKANDAAKAAGQDTSGQAINVQHFIGNVLGGFNKFALQWGKGTAGNLVYGYPAYGGTSDNRTWRVVEILQIQPTANFSLMGELIYQNAKDNYKWLSFGVRPVWHINDYFKIQGEWGHDEVRPVNPGAGDGTRKLNKYTIAPTLVAGRGFWARPELRLYYTHASWNDYARDNWGGVAGGVGGAFGNGTSGNSYGFQVETWF